MVTKRTAVPLLWTLERGLGAHWNEAVANAWIEAYATLAGFMIGRPTASPKPPSNA
jgi:hemoglobin-like flavoprotein